MQRNVKAMSRAAAVIRLSITTATPPAITPIDRRAKITGSTKSNVTRASAGCAARRRRRGAGTCAQGPKAPPLDERDDRGGDAEAQPAREGDRVLRCRAREREGGED